ncbi:unnamed protein product [Adineta ricciae]|uniref:Uncharacterized protein n=1 Tax=Adineta ricciae TaxID=249248 RepID=A0A815L9M5_ADIRI|nr:unnamed protein product [Adineta ricciae]
MSTDQVHRIKSSRVVLLHEDVEEAEKLRRILITAEIFTDADQCFDFITDIDEEITLIISDVRFLPFLLNIHQVNSIYILNENQLDFKQSPKVKGVYNNITLIINAFTQASHATDNISFIDLTNQNLNELDPLFMYTQILKEILLTIKFDEKHKSEFIKYCRELYFDNKSQLNHIQIFEEKYCSDKSIWWYTYQDFLYTMLNKGLRLMEVDVVIKMGFFLQDLHTQITALHSEQYGGDKKSRSFRVFRGQSLSYENFDKLRKIQGGLLSFNNFLSTSSARSVSFAFAESNLENRDVISIFFEIRVNPSVSSTPFANIKKSSAHQIESEILFSMHSVFRIEEIKQINGNDRFWKVNLTLTNDDDVQLRLLTESIQKRIIGSKGWDRLGQLMLRIGQFNKAKEIYNILIKESTNDREEAYFSHMIGLSMCGNGDYDQAFDFYKRSIQLNQSIPAERNVNLANSLSSLSLVYDEIDEHSKAISYYERALQVLQENLPENHLDLASSYNNIAGIYRNLGEYSIAFSYYEKAMEIQHKILLENHPDLMALRYYKKSTENLRENAIGNLYSEIQDYSQSLLFHEKASKILPENHRLSADNHNNIGNSYINMGQYSKALESFQKALNILQKTTSPNRSHIADTYDNIAHPKFATSFNHIGSLYSKLGNYPLALSYFEKALAIRHETFPYNHPDTATIYNNLAESFCNMCEYEKAISYYEKSLEIFRRTLPDGHAKFGLIYNNIGGVYNKMTEYSKALSFYKQALQIYQNAFPENHPTLAISYNNVGLGYANIGQFSEALDFHHKAVQIKLSSNDSSVATSYNNIAFVYHRIHKYEKALEFFKKALEIQQETLPSGHPHLATCLCNIGLVFSHIGDYCESLTYYEKSLQIREKCLAKSDPALAATYNGVATCYEAMNEYSKAIRFYERAQDSAQCSSPTNHSFLQNIRKKIQLLKTKL